MKDKKNWNQSKEEIRANDAWQIQKVQSEMFRGFEALYEVGPGVSIFGSARLKPGSEWYEETVKLAKILAADGYAIITGGGPGIMEAANKGAYEAGVKSVGVGIELPFENKNNEYLDKNYDLQLDYFHVRKVMFCKYSQAFICMPGGVGTIDELFEILTLVQTEKTKPVPIILVGKEFWGGLVEWMRTMLKDTMGTINESDFKNFRVVDTAKEAAQKVREFKEKYRRDDDTNF
jgi:uncharacterized protein (TIGR00730 family)